MTSVVPLMVLYLSDRCDICSATDGLNLPEEERRIAASVVAPFISAVSLQTPSF